MPDNDTLMILIPLVLLVAGLFAQAHFQNKNMHARMDRLEDRHEALRAEMREGFARVDAKVDKNHAELRSEMKEGFARVDKNHADLRTEMREGFERLDGKVDKNHAESISEFRGYDRQLATMQNSLDLLLSMHRSHPPIAHSEGIEHISEPTADD